MKHSYPCLFTVWQGDLGPNMQDSRDNKQTQKTGQLLELIENQNQN